MRAGLKYTFITICAASEGRRNGDYYGPIRG